MLIVGIILSAIAPAISSIYSVPSEWIGLKPAMILFKKLTEEKLEEISYLEENELDKYVKTSNEASVIISNNLSDCPELLSKNREISEGFITVNIGIRKAKRLYDVKINQRKEQEEEEKQQRIREKERKRREEATYEQYVQKEQRKRGLRYGVPPRDRYSCPAQFPIRATANLNETDSQGLYYFPGERTGVEVYWCFSNQEEAKADNFRRPYKTPPKRQSR